MVCRNDFLIGSPSFWGAAVAVHHTVLPNYVFSPKFATHGGYASKYYSFILTYHSNKESPDRVPHPNNCVGRLWSRTPAIV